MQTLLSEKIRLLKFFSVGLCGTIVNLSVVWFGNSLLFTSLGEPRQTWLSYALGIFLSISFNFVLNYHWTWRDRRGSGISQFFSHLGKYYLSNLAAACIQFAIANGTILLLKAYIFELGDTIPVAFKMSTSVLGIACAGLINFIINHFWNFNIKEHASKTP